MPQNKLFSRIEDNNHIIYRILGVKISLKNKNFYKQFADAEKIQDKYDLTNIKNAKKLVVFFIPSPEKGQINGGIMSIFSLCETSRKFNADAPCIISTLPHVCTYVHNDKFSNNEKIYRFSQITDNAKNVEDMILHIPECYVIDFCKSLNKKDVKFLKSIKNLHINILNQNIELMPEPKALKPLYKLTNNITQTIAHDRYATQEVCDKWGIPTHLFSVNIDNMGSYKSYPFEEKEKIIVLSPDFNEYKEGIVEKLKKELPDWELITVNNMTFSEYMDLIARAYFTITFGEGFDGYFSQPSLKGSVSFAVYNNDFFPDSSWKNFKNVYNSYEEMKENIIDDMKQLQEDKDVYMSLVKDIKAEHDKLYNYDKFRNNLQNFYNGNYDFLPQEGQIK